MGKRFQKQGRAFIGKMPSVDSIAWMVRDDISSSGEVFFEAEFTIFSGRKVELHTSSGVFDVETIEDFILKLQFIIDAVRNVKDAIKKKRGRSDKLWLAPNDPQQTSALCVHVSDTAYESFFEISSCFSTIRFTMVNPNKEEKYLNTLDTLANEAVKCQTVAKSRLLLRD